MLRKPPIHSEHYQTYAEYLRHPLFLAARQIAMQTTGGRCVRCGKPATEVHHKDYCRWGMFDPPSVLMPVCHACHCVIEGKEE